MVSQPSKPKRSTLRDVARHAKVSVATVSRVLNSSDLVTQDTRDRVTQAIDALGFAPSAAARSLNSGRTRTIGALVPTLDHSIFARYLNALEDRLSASGYSLVVAVTGGDQEVEERKARVLLEMGAEGLIVSGRTHSVGFDVLVARFRVPVLITSFFAPDAKYPTIGYDNAAIAEKALRYLYSLGHEHVAVVHGPSSINDRIAARIEGANRLSDLVSLEFLTVGMEVSGGADAIKRMVSGSALPGALLFLSDVQALGAMFELKRQGISVPSDVKLMGFDNLAWSAVCEPGITSIGLPAAQMGSAAADAMVDWIVTGLPAKSLSLEADLIERGSTRAAISLSG